MRKVFVLLTILLAIAAIQVNSAPVDIRLYIDSSATYTMADSLDTATDYSDTVWVVGCTTIAADVYVNLAGSTNCIVRLECSNNGIDFMNASGSDTAITATGQYSLVFKSAAVFRYYRLYWVSESGGTSAKLLVAFRVGGQI